MVKWALNEGGEVRNVHHSRNFEKGRRDSFLSPGSRSGGKAELKAPNLHLFAPKSSGTIPAYKAECELNSIYLSHVLLNNQNVPPCGNSTTKITE